MYSTSIQEDVFEAVASGLAVVALESTLITHGLPWPQNLETAKEAEAAVRGAGAAPATIAVIGGEIRVGLGVDELERVARGGGFAKAARRDLAVLVARGRDAGTTVSATLWVARRAGIRVMATGGLGGVHRQASLTQDISADLEELSRADGSLVVCSGFKSILDIAGSIERLETLGVAAVGYQTENWPAFTTRSSGVPIEHWVGTPVEAAAVVEAHRRLGLGGAVVLANPVSEAEEVDGLMMKEALEGAMEEAARRGVVGKEITPFLLDRVRGATGGRSLAANRALIAANAGLAAEVAVALSRSTAAD